MTGGGEQRQPVLRLLAHKPNAPAAAHTFSRFSGGSDEFAVHGADDPRVRGTQACSRVRPLSGRAVYGGPAAGKNVTRNLAAAPAGTGVLTATANLAASLNDATAAAPVGDGGGALTGADVLGAAGTVAGTISNLLNADGTSVGSWRITLGAAGMGAIGKPAADGVTADGETATQFTRAATAVVGAASVSGSWEGVFYGNDRVDGNPESIAGALEVNAPHTAIAGALGAYNQAES